MKIPSFCEHCGRIIGTYDTDIDTSIDWLEKPCGYKVCDECCDVCERENTDGINFDSCPYKDE